MADVKALALSAEHKLKTGQATTEVDAIGKAIKGIGIHGNADYRRLMSEVGTQFSRNKSDERRAMRRRA